MNILEVKNLSVSFDTFAGEVKAVRDVNFTLRQGETLAIVGESGSGKSVTSKAIARLLNDPARITNGEIIYNDQDLLQLSNKKMENIRGVEISMVFQDAMSALNPTMTAGKQIAEGLIRHFKYSKKQARERTLQLLKDVGIPNAETRINQYPHQFSGGMRQRVVIALALACNPKVLIADEPTTALDVTIQGQILDLLRDLQEKLNISIIFITHDLGVVANIADRVAVMYGGTIVEQGTVREMFYNPQHPYMWGLLSSMPKTDAEEDELIAIPGSPPDMRTPPKGCPFATRCPHVMNICIDEMPTYTDVTDEHKTACWLMEEDAPVVEKPTTAFVEGGV